MGSGKDTDSVPGPILGVDHVTKKFGALVAVSDLSFAVELTAI